MTIPDAPGSPLTPSGLASLSSAAHIIGLPHQGSDASPLRGKRAHDMRRPAPILSERLPSGQRRSRHPRFTHPAICAPGGLSPLRTDRPLVTSESPCVTRSAPDMRTWLGDRFAAAPQAWSESARRPAPPHGIRLNPSSVPGERTLPASSLLLVTGSGWRIPWCASGAPIPHPAAEPLARLSLMGQQQGLEECPGVAGLNEGTAVWQTPPSHRAQDSARCRFFSVQTAYHGT